MFFTVYGRTWVKLNIATSLVVSCGWELSWQSGLLISIYQQFPTTCLSQLPSNLSWGREKGLTISLLDKCCCLTVGWQGRKDVDTHLLHFQYCCKTLQHLVCVMTLQRLVSQPTRMCFSVAKGQSEHVGSVPHRWLWFLGDGRTSQAVLMVKPPYPTTLARDLPLLQIFPLHLLPLLQLVLCCHDRTFWVWINERLA